MEAGARPLPLTDAEIEQIERMEMRDWHIRKLWNYYVRKGLHDGVLPGDWKDGLVPTKDMLVQRFDETDHIQSVVIPGRGRRPRARNP
jgi:hypothetical protein